jgi:hypothetical protein
MSGDCFIVALAGVIGPGGLPPEARPKLVHGLPRMRRPGPSQGKRFWHAWVEVNMHGIPWVLDYSNGREASMPRSRFYELGDIEQVFRYEPQQVRRLIAKHEHAGPWVDGWEEMEDEAFRGVGVGGEVAIKGASWRLPGT